MCIRDSGDDATLRLMLHGRPAVRHGLGELAGPDVAQRHVQVRFRHHGRFAHFRRQAALMARVFQRLA